MVLVNKLIGAKIFANTGISKEIIANISAINNDNKKPKSILNNDINMDL